MWRQSTPTKALLLNNKFEAVQPHRSTVTLWLLFLETSRLGLSRIHQYVLTEILSTCYSYSNGIEHIKQIVRSENINSCLHFVILYQHSLGRFRAIMNVCVSISIKYAYVMYVARNTTQIIFHFIQLNIWNRVTTLKAQQVFHNTCHHMTLKGIQIVMHNVNNSRHKIVSLIIPI